MNGIMHRFIGLFVAFLLVCAGLLMADKAKAQAAPPIKLRVATHDSFSISPGLIQQFEREHHAVIERIALGDAGEMINKLILTRSNPIADVAYGIDNINQSKAAKAKLFMPFTPLTPSRLAMDGGLVAIDYGWVTVNVHPSALQSPLPKTLQELTNTTYRNTLVVQNPATSSPGLAFLLATRAHFGKEKMWEFWRALKANGVKVTQGWSAAYQVAFSKQGGAYPMVISYHSSPTAEWFYSDPKPTAYPTANLWLEGSYFLQVEGAGVMQGTPHPKLAQAFIEFLLSPSVQADLQTKMWMFPANPHVPLDPVFNNAIDTKALPPLPSAIPTLLWEETQILISQWNDIFR
jgi:thiamine transport system substrate-binding protein